MIEQKDDFAKRMIEILVVELAWLGCPAKEEGQAGYRKHHDEAKWNWIRASWTTLAIRLWLSFALGGERDQMSLL